MVSNDQPPNLAPEIPVPGSPPTIYTHLPPRGDGRLYRSYMRPHDYHHVYAQSTAADGTDLREEECTPISELLKDIDNDPMELVAEIVEGRLAHEGKGDESYRQKKWDLLQMMREFDQNELEMMDAAVASMGGDEKMNEEWTMSAVGLGAWTTTP